MSKEKFKRKTLGFYPIIIHFLHRMNIFKELDIFFPEHANIKIPYSKIFISLITNIASKRTPLYGMPAWADSLSDSIFKFTENEKKSLNDDRFGRCLSSATQNNLMNLILSVSKSTCKEFSINLSRCHNDGTSIHTTSKKEQKSSLGNEFKKGHNKEHRPDLKQLMISLTCSSDGMIPIHFKTYSGNVTDDKTHIETFDFIKSINSKKNILYIGDKKLCTESQIGHILAEKGQVICPVPETFSEVKEFKRETMLKKRVYKGKEILRRLIPGRNDKRKEYFYLIKSCSRAFQHSKERTQEYSAQIYFVRSSEKMINDKNARNKYISKINDSLEMIKLRCEQTDKRKTYSSKSRFESAINKVIEKDSKKIFEITTKFSLRKDGTEKYSIRWKEKSNRVKELSRLDGIFPMLCSDKKVDVSKVIRYYREQPRLENRFHYLKRVNDLAPLFLKNIDRIEGLIAVSYFSLMVQSIIEREIRKSMKDRKIKSIPLYNEGRECLFPTAALIKDLFEQVSIYEYEDGEKIKEKLNDTQKQVLDLLGIKQSKYWSP